MSGIVMPWIERESTSKRRRYLVGVSGGADSVALLHLLVRAGFTNLVVCHLDHRLRGRTSTEDARWVKRLAARLGVGFELGRESVSERAERDRISIEAVGRAARHAFFSECGRKWRCDRLLLAHHADDQAETVLWNLLRGSRGAVGMPEERELLMEGRPMTVIRPLLGVSRRELRAWLSRERIRWREDASNAEPVAVRNRLRHEALPLLEEISGRDVTGPLKRAAVSGEELREIEAWAVARAAVVDPRNRLHLPALRKLPQALQGACVRDFLKKSGVPDLGRKQVGQALEMLKPGSVSAVALPGGWMLRRRQGRMWVEASKRSGE